MQAYIVSTDGTVIPMKECIIVNLDDDEIVSLLSNYSDSEIFEMAKMLHLMKHINTDIYDLLQEDPE